MAQLTGTQITVLSTVIPAVAAAWHVALIKIRPTITRDLPKIVAAADKAANDIGPALTAGERVQLQALLTKAVAYAGEAGVTVPAAPQSAMARPAS